MKKILIVILTVLMTSGLFATKIVAKTDPSVTVTYDATNRVLVVSSTNDYISKVTEADTDTEIRLDGWSVWGRESNVITVSSDGKSFSMPVYNALGGRYGDFSFKITMCDEYKDVYSNYETTVTIPEPPNAQVTSMSFNEDTKAIDIVCGSSDYFNYIKEIYLKDTWSTGFGDTNNITKDANNNSFSITTLNGIGENNGDYTFKIIADGYKMYSQQYTVSCYGGGGGGSGEIDPPTVTVSYSESTKLITVAAEDAYVQSLNSIEISGDFLDVWGCPVTDTDLIKRYNGYFTFDASFPVWYNGTYSFTIYAGGYKNYSTNVDLTGFHEPPVKRTYPAVINAEINNDGDLIITSSDSQFINDLIKPYSPGTDVISGTGGGTITLGGDYNIPEYFFGIHNSEANEFGMTFRPLEKVDNNTVKFAVAKQLNNKNGHVYRGQVMKHVAYTLKFGLPGYSGNDTLSGTFTFKNANTMIPTEHVKTFIADGFVIITADKQGKDFMDNMYYGRIAILDSKNEIAEMIEFSEDDRVTPDDYDTISLDYDRVYQVNTSSIKNPSEWTALIDSPNYGQYCYDGRTFGGVVDITVEPLDVKKTGLGNIDLGSDKWVGLYKLPEYPNLDAVENKVLRGWKVKNKGKDYIRCSGDVIFITSDTEIYAIFEDEPEPVRFNPNPSDIVANKVIIINIEGNAFTASLKNGEFLSEEDKNTGAEIWVEANFEDDADNEIYNQFKEALKAGVGLSADKLKNLFEVDVYKQLKGQTKPIRISETEKGIEISLDLSGNPDVQALAEAGKLGIYSIHDGKLSTKTIRGTYDKATKIYTVIIYEFSTFAFVEDVYDPSSVIDSSPNRTIYKLPRTGVGN